MVKAKKFTKIDLQKSHYIHVQCNHGVRLITFVHGTVQNYRIPSVGNHLPCGIKRNLQKTQILSECVVLNNQCALSVGFLNNVRIIPDGFLNRGHCSCRRPRSKVTINGWHYGKETRLLAVNSVKKIQKTKLRRP